MIDFIELMWMPMLAVFIIAGIHVYYGLHVVQRGVIFVDLALAQVSAFGATVGFLMGFDLDSPHSYVLALVFTIVGAFLFTFTRSRDPRVPQEAIIGTVYAVSAAAAILVLSRAPEGGEELKAIMVGHLLFVDWMQIGRTAAMYGVIAVVLWRCRRPLHLVTHDPEEAYTKGLNVRWWDFVFYATFGFVVTNAVQIIGVLLVFAYLIVPAVCAVYLTNTTAHRLLIGWAVSMLTSILGIVASYVWDLPTGATIVCTFAISLVVCSAFSTWIRFVRT
jgi:zinc/manganese transport system permease protein